jgi:hypothetical protein
MFGPYIRRNVSRIRVTIEISSSASNSYADLPDVNVTRIGDPVAGYMFLSLAEVLNYQNRKLSPTELKPEPRDPKLSSSFGQKQDGKTSATLLKNPNPNLWIASVFHDGNGGLNVIEFAFKTPNGSVQTMMSA